MNGFVRGLFDAPSDWVQSLDSVRILESVCLICCCNLGLGLKCWLGPYFCADSVQRKNMGDRGNEEKYTLWLCPLLAMLLHFSFDDTYSPFFIPACDGWRIPILPFIIWFYNHQNRILSPRKLNSILLISPIDFIISKPRFAILRSKSL